MSLAQLRRRQYWSLLMTESQAQIEVILNTLGIP